MTQALVTRRKVTRKAPRDVKSQLRVQEVQKKLGDRSIAQPKGVKRLQAEQRVARVVRVIKRRPCKEQTARCS
eukprot:s4280_g2.t1